MTKNNLEMTSILIRDRTFLCESHRIASIMNRYNNGNTYVYQFDYKEHWIDYPFLGGICLLSYTLYIPFIS